ncbi:hypothetical protein U9M48_032145 [Paspalum notatum var. saurae]|uniref:Uncharacterized protein n=1 Tax=Paspalum notatum var. saurae TaxID=547442 RepID=A0AAQ3X5G1_PASNO
MVRWVGSDGKIQVIMGLNIKRHPVRRVGEKERAVCCYFVTWNFASLTQVIVLNQPSVRKLLSMKPKKPTSPTAEGPTGSTGDDSRRPVSDHEQHLPPERREASDSSIVQVKDQSDKKSEKDS